MNPEPAPSTPRITGPLHWEQHGRSGPPMVFVHPNPTDHDVWIYQQAHFSTWCRTIGIDLPGYGRSPRALPGVTMTDVARACWEAVDEVSAEPAILAGCSVGFTAVLHMAHLQPERVTAVLLSGCSYRPVKDFAPKRIEEYGREGVAFRRPHFFQGVGPAFRGTELARYFADLFEERNDTADAGSIVEVYRALGEPDPDWLFETAAPVLILTGSEDGAHEAAFDLRDRIPGAELVTIEAAGHCCNLEQPWTWDRHALEFLRRHRALP